MKISPQDTKNISTFSPQSRKSLHKIPRISQHSLHNHENLSTRYQEYLNSVEAMTSDNFECFELIVKGYGLELWVQPLNPRVSIHHLVSG